MSAASLIPIPEAIPYFGRAWQISIQKQPPDGDTYTFSGQIPNNEPLKMAFEIEQTFLSVYWTAEVTLTNLNTATQLALLNGSPVLQFNQPITNGDQLSISAGYAYGFNQQSNLLFQGTVFQPMWTREGVTDWTVRLRCIVGLMEDANNFVNFSFGPNATQQQIVTELCSQAHLPIESIDQDALNQRKLPRGQVFHGRPMELLRQIAKQNNLQLWVSPRGVNMRSIGNKFTSTSKPDIVYAPSNAPAPAGSKPTIIGVPEQTQEGLTFRVEMDSQVKIGSVVQLSGTAINQRSQPLPGQGLPSVLDPDGLYSVYSIRHVGDSRGDDWYTEIAGLTWRYWDFWNHARTLTQ